MPHEVRERRARLQTYALLLQRLRLWSGVALFLYVTTHLANHALGLISLAAMEVGRDWFLSVWRGPVGSPALYGSLTIHSILALVSLYQRRYSASLGGKGSSLFSAFLFRPF